MILWDVVTSGTPAPTLTREQLLDLKRGDGACPERSPDPNDRGWWCNRSRDHTGSHIAIEDTAEHICCIWTDELEADIRAYRHEQMKEALCEVQGAPVTREPADLQMDGEGVSELIEGGGHSL